MSSKHYHIPQRDFLIAVKNLKDLRDPSAVDDARPGCRIVGILVRYARFYLNGQFSRRYLQRTSNLI